VHSVCGVFGIQIYSEVAINYEHYANYYKIISRLGHGSFGIVYRAYDRTANTEVALKIISLRHAGKSHLLNAASTAAAGGGVAGTYT
jgi:serine/threonine protein kinase